MSVRDRLLQAGEQILHEQGWPALTQPRIAKAAGVSQSHLTYYFPTRNALLVAIAEYSVDQALQRQLTQAPVNPAHGLAEALAFLPRTRMLLGLVTAADADTSLRPALDRLVAHVRRTLLQLLQHLGFQPEAASVLLCHATIVGLAVMHLGRQSPESEAEITTGLAQLFELLPRATTASCEPSASA